jgi:hypothetical protein
MEGLVDLAVIRKPPRLGHQRRGEVAGNHNLGTLLPEKRNAVHQGVLRCPRGIINQSAPGNALAASSTAATAVHLKPCGEDGYGEACAKSFQRMFAMQPSNIEKM